MSAPTLNARKVCSIGNQPWSVAPSMDSGSNAQSTVATVSIMRRIFFTMRVRMQANSKLSDRRCQRASAEADYMVEPIASQTQAQSAG